MDIRERILLMTEIAGKASGVGKTAMMKFMYLLQTLYHVPLGYHFEIYTYGPFCQTVMSDIEYAEFTKMIDVSSVLYPSGFTGYSMEVTDQGKEQIKENSGYLDPFNGAVDGVLNFFGTKTAKELELYSTIVYVVKANLEDKLGTDACEICKTVKEIKPHFSDDTIRSAFEDLQESGMLEKIHS